MTSVLYFVGAVVLLIILIAGSIWLAFLFGGSSEREDRFKDERDDLSKDLKIRSNPVPTDHDHHERLRRIAERLRRLRDRAS